MSSRFGEFRVVKPDGADEFDDGVRARGGQAEVYMVTDYTGKRLGLKVSMKKSAEVDHPAMLKTEVEILLRFNHPNIVKVVKDGQTNDEVPLPFYVMEWYPKSLEAFCKSYLTNTKASSHFGKEQYSLPEPLALGIWRQIVGAFRQIRQRGYIHADLKSTNIMIDDSDPLNIRPILIDFGTAIRFTARNALSQFPSRSGGVHQNESVKGRTEWWSAPELQDYYLKCRGLQLGGVQDSQQFDLTKADIWSLGMVLYYLLFGHEPHNPGLDLKIDNSGSVEEIGISRKLFNKLIELLPAIIEKDQAKEFESQIQQLAEEDNPEKLQKQFVIGKVEALDIPTKMALYNRMHESLHNDYVTLLMCFVTKYPPTKIMESHYSKLVELNAIANQRLNAIEDILQLKKSNWWLNAAQKVELESMFKKLYNFFSRSNNRDHPINQLVQEVTTEISELLGMDRKASTFLFIEEARAKLAKIAHFKSKLEEEEKKWKNLTATIKEKAKQLTEMFKEEPTHQDSLLTMNTACTTDESLLKEFENVRNMMILLSKHLQLYLQSTGINLTFPVDRRVEPISKGTALLLKNTLQYYIDKRASWTDLLGNDLIQFPGVWRQKAYEDRLLEREKSIKVGQQLLMLSKCPQAYVSLEEADLFRRLHYLLARKNCLWIVYYQFMLLEEQETGLAAVLDDKNKTNLTNRLDDSYELFYRLYEATFDMVVEDLDPQALDRLELSAISNFRKPFTFANIKEEILELKKQMQTVLVLLKNSRGSLLGRLDAELKRPGLLQNLRSSTQFIRDAYVSATSICSGYENEDSDLLQSAD